ncbi:MAG: helix-turn-helix transcriptional regulator [Hespellia sp.]|nr:helix-turn-helix transcriptional regulator [Hespellia sp.]
MNILEAMEIKKITQYRLAVQSGVPHATLSDIINGKTRIEKCSGETLYKLSNSLGVTIEDLISDSIERAAMERSWEHGLPEYLQNDLDAYKQGVKEKSSLLDCLWGELYGSINCAEINEGSITHEHAQYLRDKYL